MSKHLDDMVREFREYAEGKNGYDELDFKADLLAWHREECEKMIPSKVEWTVGEARQFSTDPAQSHMYQFGYNQAIDDIRASLEVEGE